MMPMFVLGIKDNTSLLLFGAVGFYIFIMSLVFFFSAKNAIYAPLNNKPNSSLSPTTELDIARIRIALESESMRRNK